MNEHEISNIVKKMNEVWEEVKQTNSNYIKIIINNIQNSQEKDVWADIKNIFSYFKTDTEINNRGMFSTDEVYTLLKDFAQSPPCEAFLIDILKIFKTAKDDIKNNNMPDAGGYKKHYHLLKSNSDYLLALLKRDQFELLFTENYHFDEENINADSGTLIDKLEEFLCFLNKIDIQKFGEKDFIKLGIKYQQHYEGQLYPRKKEKTAYRVFLIKEIYGLLTNKYLLNKFFTDNSIDHLVHEIVTILVENTEDIPTLDSVKKNLHPT